MTSDSKKTERNKALKKLLGIAKNAKIPFEREEDDLHITIPISFSQAVLGDEIDVPTIDGTASLKIPAGTASETIFRMKEKGIPHLQQSSSGDQMVKVRIEVPKKISNKQKELIKQLNEDKPIKIFLKKIFG